MAQPRPEAHITCPYTAHKDLCSKHFANCPKWINIVGVDPQTGESVNQWDCADTWIPKLMIENSQMQRQTGAAVESFRNEMVKSQEVGLKVLMATAQGIQPKAISHSIDVSYEEVNGTSKEG